ncbi:UBX domain-containing protein 7 [Portunus trituberculatus]|uniref:UBX domain-containing protein 7 n=1 Tax=Portunus trituberculatus TaxID=210409 RepID=A0A5B7FXJ3_PORTR|nr:UBX domain-containing protein 7 [Portunus trituberculatus]
MAINMHMEGAVDSGSTQVAGPASMATEEVAVRAPIPQKQEVLVEGPDEIAFSFRGRRRTVRSVFDKFRDFEAETIYSKHQTWNITRLTGNSLVKPVITTPQPRTVKYKSSKCSQTCLSRE